MSARTAASGPRAAGLFKTLFLVAALYDGVLGLAFFFFYRPLFDALGIPLPENASYIHLTAGFIFVQGVGYWLVYRNMLRNVDIVKIGVVYKAIYSGVALYYLAAGELLDAIFAWFAAFDLVFLALFIAFLVWARSREGAAMPQRSPR